MNKTAYKKGFGGRFAKRRYGARNGGLQRVEENRSESGGQSPQNQGPGNNRNGGNGGNGNGGMGGSPNRNPQNLAVMLVATLITLLLVSFFMREVNGSTTKEITYTEFIEMLDKGEVDVEGKIDSFTYSDVTSVAKKGESLLNRLFG